MENTNEIVDFTFEIMDTGLFDSVTVPPKDEVSYARIEINKLEALESSMNDLNVNCKLRTFTQQDLDNMRE